MWAIIGGSGFENFANVELVEECNVTTPFGKPSSGLKRIRIQGQECLFLSRHGQHHELLPSEINFRANIFALKKLGATQILAASAVGSLEQVLKPGDMVVPNQYIDRTKSLRAHTFCGDGVVGHVSLAHPVCGYWTEVIQKLATKLNFTIHFHKTAVCIEGPCFSTQAESQTYIAAGAHIIGMTSFPEYALAREAGLGFVPASFVTDYDCWDNSIEHVTLAEVIAVMRQNNQKAFDLISLLVQEPEPTADVLKYADAGLKTGLFVDVKKLKAEQQEWLEVLMK